MRTDLEFEAVEALPSSALLGSCREYRHTLHPPLSRSGAWIFFTFLIVTGSLARVAAVFQYNPLEILITDPGRWWFTATHWSDIQPISAIDAFGYPLWLGLVVKLTGGGELALAIHNAVLSVVTPWIWYRLVRELTQDGDVAYGAWAVFCCSPSWIAIYSYTMSETLLLPLFGLALWMTVRARRVQSVQCFGLAALIWALASATRVFALPFAAVALLWVLIQSRSRMRKLAAAGLVFAAVAIPLAVRSQYRLHIARPFGFPEMNQIYVESGKETLRFSVVRDHGAYKWLYEFGSPSLYQQPFEPLSHWKSTRTGVVSFDINEDNAIADWDRALEQNRLPWRQLLPILKENYIFFYFAPSWPDNNPNRLADRLQVMLRWIWAPLGAMVILGNLYYKRQLQAGAAALFPLLTTLAWMLTPLSPALMEGRYRKPVEGLLLVNLFLLLWCWRNASAQGYIGKRITEELWTPAPMRDCLAAIDTKGHVLSVPTTKIVG